MIDAERHPRRTCVGCRAVRARSELIRCRLGMDGSLVFENFGRGCWLCPSMECFDVAGTSRRFTRALRGDVSLTSLADARIAFVQLVAYVGG